MNRTSEASVTNPNGGKLLVINRTDGISRTAPTTTKEAGQNLGVARVVSHLPPTRAGDKCGGGAGDDLDSYSLSTNSNFKSILSSSETSRKRFVPLDSPQLEKLKEKIERQKASRNPGIVPNVPTKGAKNPVVVRKVASAQGPNTYLGFNTGVEKQLVQVTSLNVNAWITMNELDVFRRQK